MRSIRLNFRNPCISPWSSGYEDLFVFKESVMNLKVESYQMGRIS